MKDENILVVRRSVLESLGMFQGLCFEADRYLPVLLARENNFFTPRAPAETNPDLKQIIPYVLLVHGDRVFQYVRGKKSGEQRLVAKGSVGIGGHMNDTDEGLFSFDAGAYRNAVEREVAEEMFIETPYTDHIVALLNDDSNEVGKVHLGVVHIFRLAEEKARKREAVITEAGFVPIAELQQRRDALETWSQLCIDEIDRLLAAARVS
jgi:predicted NUDIX family phosphoesterase